MESSLLHMCRIPTEKSITIQHKTSDTCPMCQAEKALWAVQELHRSASGVCFTCSEIAKTPIPYPCETFNLVQPF
jgi:hypothetical protein